MKKGSFLNSISALVLLAFAVIWIINICVGNNMSEALKGGIEKAYAIIILFIFVVYIFGDNSLPSGMVWVFVFIFLTYLPSLCAIVASFLGFDLTVYAVFNTILVISQAIVYVPFYIILMYRSCQITESWVFRLIFIVIGLFLIFSAIAVLIPSLANALPFPLLGLNS